MSRRVLLLIGETAEVDPGLLRGVAGDAAQRAGWSLVEHEPDAIVQVAGGGDGLAEAGGLPLLRIELDVGAPVLGVPQVRAHGLDTVAFPIADWLRGLDRPAERLPYGPDLDEWLEVRRPAGEPFAIGLLVHGGYYHSKWEASLMNGIAADLADRGWLAVNLEYGRPDRVGWDATVADVIAGLAASRRLAPGLPVAMFGHSAGGQLVLQVVESIEPDPTVLAVSMAGVVDLVAAHARFMGEDAVRLALGGTPEELPERYAAASPAQYGSRRGGWLLVQGSDDSLDLQDMNLRLSRSDALGRPELVTGPGDHFAVIDPEAAIWRAAETRAHELLGRTSR